MCEVLNGQTVRSTWTVKLNSELERSNWMVKLNGETGRWNWTVRLDGETERWAWTVKLNGETEQWTWTVKLNGVHRTVTTWICNSCNNIRLNSVYFVHRGRKELRASILKLPFCHNYSKHLDFSKNLFPLQWVSLLKLEWCHYDHHVVPKGYKPYYGCVEVWGYTRRRKDSKLSINII